MYIWFKTPVLSRNSLPVVLTISALSESIESPLQKTDSDLHYVSVFLPPAEADYGCID